MDNSYRFFNNKECKYFPCHKTEKPDEFNCLFCYCPLYLLEDCGGNYTYIKHVKDCSACGIPHAYKGYDYINGKLMEEIEKKRSKKEE